jgi:hypothetical protein
VNLIALLKHSRTSFLRYQLLNVRKQSTHKAGKKTSIDSMDHSLSNYSFLYQEHKRRHDATDGEMFASPLKRIRLTDTVLLETPNLAPSPAKEDDRMAWWNQKPIRETRKPPTSDSCAVCQRIFSNVTTPPRGLRNTTLWTYFQPSHAVSQPVVLDLETSLGQRQSCTFCEKQVCHECMASCEICGHGYCKFCRTVDYDADGFVTDLCLDCRSETALARSSQSKADDMQIG